jgi:hypothetical protein
MDLRTHCPIPTFCAYAFEHWSTCEGRLTSHRSSRAFNSFSDTSKNVNFGYTCNLAGQPMTMTPDNSAYINTTSPAATSYTTDGQNRYTTVGGNTLTYDGLSDLKNDGTNTYSFDSLNRMYVLNGTTISYDALSRPNEIATGSTINRLLYSGQQVIATYNVSRHCRSICAGPRARSNTFVVPRQ